MEYPKTRKEAKEQGAKYYYTGEPCKHGHVALRKTKGACVECLKIEWEKGNQTRSEYFKAYNESDAGKKAKKDYYEEVSIKWRGVISDTFCDAIRNFDISLL
jgi:hypothetical protein